MNERRRIMDAVSELPRYDPIDVPHEMAVHADGAFIYRCDALDIISYHKQACLAEGPAENDMNYCPRIGGLSRAAAIDIDEDEYGDVPDEDIAAMAKRKQELLAGKTDTKVDWERIADGYSSPLAEAVLWLRDRDVATTKAFQSLAAKVDGIVTDAARQDIPPHRHHTCDGDPGCATGPPDPEAMKEERDDTMVDLDAIKARDDHRDRYGTLPIDGADAVADRHDLLIKLEQLEAILRDYREIDAVLTNKPPPKAETGWTGNWQDEFCSLKAGWNGYDARPITIEAIKTATALQEALPKVFVVPTPVGGVQLEFAVAGYVFEVEVASDGMTIHGIGVEDEQDG